MAPPPSRRWPPSVRRVEPAVRLSIGTRRHLSDAGKKVRISTGVHSCRCGPGIGSLARRSQTGGGLLRHVLCSFLLEAAKFTSKSRYVCRERELSQKSGAILRLLQWTFATDFPFVFHRCQFCRETQEFCNSRF